MLFKYWRTITNDTKDESSIKLGHNKSTENIYCVLNLFLQAANNLDCKVLALSKTGNYSVLFEIYSAKYFLNVVHLFLSWKESQASDGFLLTNTCLFGNVIRKLNHESRVMYLSWCSDCSHCLFCGDEVKGSKRYKIKSKTESCLLLSEFVMSLTRNKGLLFEITHGNLEFRQKGRNGLELFSFCKC